MYIVMEIQITDSCATLVWSFTDRNQAEAKYHAVLAAASVSEVKKHSAVLMAENGVTIKQESYFHESEESE